MNFWASPKSCFVFDLFKWVAIIKGIVSQHCSLHSAGISSDCLFHAFLSVSRGKDAVCSCKWDQIKSQWPCWHSLGVTLSGRLQKDQWLSFYELTTGSLQVTLSQNRVRRSMSFWKLLVSNKTINSGEMIPRNSQDFI